MLNGTKAGVLLVHNAYQQPGGEDRVFEFEGHLLEAHGHPVHRYQDHNHRIRGMGAFDLALNTLWNRSSRREIASLLGSEQVGVVHVHNTFPLISPSVYYAARRAGVPVVQTLHNYRLLCPDAKLMRNGECCEECLGRGFAWPGVLHGCYQNSRKTTAVTAGMIAAHKLFGTWSRVVDRYIALTGFARGKFIEGGLPAEKIVVKPNFVDPDPGCGDGAGGYALFAGRLSPEKGISTLIGGWDRLGGGLRLHVAGDGPLAGQVREAASRNPRIVWLGALRAEQVNRQMQGARFLVCPSIWYESFGLVIVEAFATGLPVVGSDLGAMAELIQNERTGLLFPPGDEAALARAVQSLIDRPALLDHMRGEARREYEQYYTASRNYDILMTIYRNAKQQQRTPPIEGQTFDDYRTRSVPLDPVAKQVHQPQA